MVGAGGRLTTPADGKGSPDRNIVDSREDGREDQRQLDTWSVLQVHRPQPMSPRTQYIPLPLREEQGFCKWHY